MSKKNYEEWLRSFEDDKKYIQSLQLFPDSGCAWRIAIDNVKPNSDVLSAGCGAGREVSYLVNQLKCNVTAIDYSPKMIKLSHELEPDAEYILGDMVECNYKKKFDFIICLWNTVNFLPNLNARKKFIEKCYDDLKPNGMLILQTSPREGCWKTFIMSVLSDRWRAYYYPESQIDRWFENSGFEIRKQKIGSEIIILAVRK